MNHPAQTNVAFNPSRTPMPQRKLFLLAACGLFALTVVFHLGATQKGWRIYREQHLGTALEYARGKIDLLNPIVVGFNANSTPTPQELPVWQAATAVLFKAFGPWFGWANVASLLFALAALWPVFQLAKASAGERGAWWTLLFFLTQPLIFYLSGRGGTDGSCLTLTIWFVYFADRLVRTGHWQWFAPAAVFGALSAVTKAPFFFCAGLASFFLLLIHGRRSLTRWAMLAGVGLVALIIFMLWSRHTAVVVAQAEFPLVDLRLSGGSDGGEFMKSWYFGDLNYRLNPVNWMKGGWRFLTTQLGSFALVGLLGWSLFRSGNRLGQVWMLAGCLTTLVFTHLVLHHHHYYLMFSPAVALLCGVAAERLEARLGPGRNVPPGLVILLSAGILSLGTGQGLIGLKVTLDGDPYPKQVVALLRQHTAPEDKLLIQGGGWGGHLLFLSDRKGLSLWDTKLLEPPENLRRIQELGYTKLVMVSESPMLLAMQQTNPGQSDQKRDSYEAHITPVAQPWRTLFQTADVLIKEIPRAASAK